MSDTAKIIAEIDNHLIFERDTNGEKQLGFGRIMKDGESIDENSEALLLSKRPNSETFDIHVIHTGPARVSNQRYRDNYDAIFGKTKAGKNLPN